MQKNNQNPTALIVSSILLGLFITACSKPFATPTSPIESEMASIVCPESYEVTLDFFSQLVSQKGAKNEQLTEDEFAQAMAVDDAFNGAAGTYVKTNLYSLYLEFFQDVTYLSSYESNSNLNELVSELKVEDTDNHLRKEMVEKYKNKINVISQDLRTMGYSCTDKTGTVKPEEPNPEPGPTPAPNAPTPRNVMTKDLINSMRKVFAVTYQSCAVLDQAPMDKNSRNIQGVKEECCHESGRGLKRHISNLSALVATHPYIQDSYKSQCFNIRKSPLIYDFGGRPAFTRGSAGKLNFFSNWGGSEVLGYDCSALIYTVLMGAGIRLKENKLFVASDVVAAQSRQFLSPESKGWSCMKSVDFTNETAEPLLEGDIASMNGHTFMIYRVGKDPYGIDGISDCKKIDVQKFDFDILQSSPSKDGVGVNVYIGKDYLGGNEAVTMRNGFIEYAKNYCERVKNGSKKKIKLDSFSIVRMSTKSACRMPAVQLHNESCVKECI